MVPRVSTQTPVPAMRTSNTSSAAACLASRRYAELREDNAHVVSQTGYSRVISPLDHDYYNWHCLASSLRSKEMTRP